MISKKIADVSVPRGGAEGGGDPSLPPVGKAQDGVSMVGCMPGSQEFVALDNSGQPAGFGENADEAIADATEFIYGRPGENPNAPGSQVHIPIQAHEMYPIRLLTMALAKNKDGSVYSQKHLEEAKELAKTDFRFANALHGTGVKLDRKILAWWGLAEQNAELTSESPNLADAQKNITESLPDELIPAPPPVGYLEIAAGVVGGSIQLTPKLMDALREAVKTESGTAAMLHFSGIELDREILVRWGLAENYKPKMEGVDGTSDNSEGRGKEDEDRGVDGGNPAALAEGYDGGQGRAVAAGNKDLEDGCYMMDGFSLDGLCPEAAKCPACDKERKMKALRDICAGKISFDPNSPANTNINEAWRNPSAIEVDLCGFKSYNEIDGEDYVCGKEVHGPKVKHGEWIKI